MKKAEKKKRKKPKSKVKPRIQQTQQHKKDLILAMTANLGIVTASCQQANLNRCTFYEYYNSDDDFKKAIDDIQEQALDYVEGKLFGLIEDSDVASTLFYLKTKGKKRGYVERTEIEAKVTNDIQVDLYHLSYEQLKELANSGTDTQSGKD